MTVKRFEKSSTDVTLKSMHSYDFRDLDTYSNIYSTASQNDDLILFLSDDTYWRSYI